MKGFGILMIAACLFTAVACSKDETTEENALTRGASVNDSTQNNGGITITVDTAWNGESHIRF